MDVNRDAGLDGGLRVPVEPVIDYRSVFKEIVGSFNTSASVKDSVVRLDQEAAIAEQLRQGKAVLVRGVWRIGKTSTFQSLENHQFPGKVLRAEARDLWPRVGNTEKPEEKLDLDLVAHYIVDREETAEEVHIDEGHEERREAERSKFAELRRTISESGMSGFEYLNRYLGEKNEKLLLLIDEVIGVADFPERLAALAHISTFSNLQIALVVHKFASRENQFKEVFEGFNTHFVRALSREEVGILIRRPLNGLGIEVTDEAVDEIFRFTGGRPQEVNAFGNKFFFSMQARKIYKKSYGVDEVKDTADAILTAHSHSEGEWRRTAGEWGRAAEEDYLRVCKEALSVEERNLLRRLTGEDEVPVDECDGDVVQSLIDITYVIREGDTYQINGGLLKGKLLNIFEYLQEQS